jgi:hypothetical protein
MFLFFVVLAAILLLAGAVVLQARALSERPDSSDYADYDTYLLALEVWQRNQRVIGFVGSLLLDAGVVLFVITGFMIALQRPDLPDGVRRTALSMPIWLAIIWLLGFFLFGSLLGSVP